MSCFDCELEAKKKRNKDIENTILTIKKDYKYTNGRTETIAIVRLANGNIGYRANGHESLARLETLLYVFVTDGVVAS